MYNIHVSPKEKNKRWGFYENVWPPSHDEWKPRGWLISLSTSSPCHFLFCLLQSTGRKAHTHIQIKTQCEFVMDHNKYMFTHQWSTHFICYITGEILVSVKSQDFTFGGIQWSMYIECLVLSANVSAVEWK